MKAKNACIALFLLVMLMLIGLPSNRAVAACYGSSCNGKDPVDEGCSGYTATYRTLTGVAGRIQVQLRYSPGCNANWSRTISLDQTKYLLAGLDNLGYGTAIYGGTVYSDMWNGGVVNCAYGGAKRILSAAWNPYGYAPCA
ncbi:MAG: hypothetical protein KatS3mg053_0502 [Candidatus Roseilinea sp.]|nr:MAG: hypothetical protein KatS3mg053_0502 [Candidatus Roseilinea sp.]